MRPLLAVFRGWPMVRLGRLPCGVDAHRLSVPRRFHPGFLRLGRGGRWGCCFWDHSCSVFTVS